MMMTLTTRIMMTMMMMMMTLSDRHLWIRTLRYHFWTSLPLCSQYRGQAPLKMRLILMFRVYRYQYTLYNIDIDNLWCAFAQRMLEASLLRRNSWKHILTFSMSDKYWECRKLTFPFLWWAHERMHTPADLAFAQRLEFSQGGCFLKYSLSWKGALSW